MMLGPREQGGAATSSAITAVSSVISSTAKNFLHEFFERVDWPLHKGLPRGAEFFSGPLGDIVKQHGLQKAQVLRQLLNYKRGKYTQVSILLNPLDLDETLREGIECTTQFVTSTLRRICSPEDDSSTDFWKPLPSGALAPVHSNCIHS